MALRIGRFLQLMDGTLEPSDGAVRRHAKLSIARFTQHHIDMMEADEDAVVRAGPPRIGRLREKLECCLTTLSKHPQSCLHSPEHGQEASAEVSRLFTLHLRNTRETIEKHHQLENSIGFRRRA